MNILKQASILSVCLITACAAPKRVALESQPEKTPSVVELKTTPTLKTAAAPTNTPLKSPSTLSSWELSGAIAAKNNKKGWTASLNWLQQGPNQYQIRLFGPLGGGTVLIEKHGSVVTFTDGPKKKSATNAEELLQKETGIRLPVNNLYYWVRGLPAPNSAESTHRDTENRIISINQGGYTINYTGYTTVGDMNLPSKIRLQGHGVMIKLVIKHWNV